MTIWEIKVNRIYKKLNSNNKGSELNSADNPNYYYSFKNRWQRHLDSIRKEREEYFNYLQKFK